MTESRDGWWLSIIKFGLDVLLIGTALYVLLHILTGGAV